MKLCYIIHERLTLGETRFQLWMLSNLWKFLTSSRHGSFCRWISSQWIDGFPNQCKVPARKLLGRTGTHKVLHSMLIFHLWRKMENSMPNETFGKLLRVEFLCVRGELYRKSSRIWSWAIKYWEICENCFRPSEKCSRKKIVNALIFHDKAKFLGTVRSKIKHCVESLWCKYLLFNLFIHIHNSVPWKAKSVEHSWLSRSLIFIHSCMISVRFSLSLWRRRRTEKNLWIFAFVEKLYGMLGREREKLISARVPHSKWKMKDREFLVQAANNMNEREKGIGKKSTNSIRISSCEEDEESRNPCRLKNDCNTSAFNLLLIWKSF